MKDNKMTDAQSGQSDAQGMLELGEWLGLHEAFGVIANRCSAADAECLKRMRDSGHYKRLGLSWEMFCKERAGISRVHADRQIHHLEEFGPNYFRMSEVLHISTDTYRLIAAAVSDEGLDLDGKKIPLLRENRQQVMAAVGTLREKAKPKQDPKSGIDLLCRRLKTVLEEVKAMDPVGTDRLILIGALDESARNLSGLSRELRARLTLA